jgi:DUF1680 family protein
MLRLAVSLAAIGALTASQAPIRGGYPITAVPLSAVRMEDGFWRARMDTNRQVTVPHILKQNEITGRVANLARAAKRSSGAYEGRRFNDTDVYKAIEAASYVLAQQRDPTLERQLADLIAVIAAAQEPDGYLYPARTIDPANPAPGAGPARWVHLNGSHELYNAGHLYEAAVAHFEATGKRSLLNVAIKNANLIRATFGPRGRKAIPGHQEIELALIRLADASGDRAYVDLAKFFLDQRGGVHQIEPYPDGPFAMYNSREYKQDHLPVTQQDRAVGHAVRATYMYAGMTDVAAATGDAAYRIALDRLYADLVSRRLYLTGGIGARSGTEAFGEDYELPNGSAYAETCAAIGLEQWAHRMFRLHGDAKYLDLAELVLYNGALSGVSIGGDRFFYQNPLASNGSVTRSAYFDVACCPANLSRTIARLPSLVYGSSASTVYIALFASSQALIDVKGQRVRISQRSNYPWDGDIEVRVEPDANAVFTLAVRIPGWARGKTIDSDLYRFHQSDVAAPTLTVNGEVVRVSYERGFAQVTRLWRPGDVVHFYVPMPVQRVLAHDSVRDNRSRAALQRGPLVYAIESADNGAALDAVELPLSAEVAHTFRADLLGGVTVLTATARTGTASAAPRTITAIPYFAWANRTPGEMVVWLRTGS